ncbi:MAG: MotA/TolQ/ExbB proton channel family protein [Calditrichaeota bacterium]|nr:MAG: MotA/TolQ/ExbB proton channel family protein [Calditrichota bacterium]
MPEFFQRGGIMMYPLLLSSIIALVYIIERAVSLRRKKVLIPEIISVVENLNSAKDLEMARAICERHEGPLPALVTTTLQNTRLPREELREVLQEQGRQDIRTLQKGLGILETIAAIAPLMGLLGTVLGMVDVFAVISDKGIGQTAALSGGIAQALLTTVTGLFIGIPVLVAYNYFSGKAESLILDIEKYANNLILKLSRLENHSGSPSDNEENPSCN